MARRWYEPKNGGTKLQLHIDPHEFVQADDQARLAIVQEIQGLSDALRVELATSKGFQDLDSYDSALQDEEWSLLDRLDYYDYENRQESLSVRDGSWFTPEAIESFCGEHQTNVATNSVDGDNTSIWQHFQTERHQIIYRLRGYPKKVTKVRFRYGTLLPARERLKNLDIRMARDLSQIDVAGNLLEEGLDIDWPLLGGAWVEHVLTTPKHNARYIKLEFDTDDLSNNAQIREFAVRVETRDP